MLGPIAHIALTVRDPTRTAGLLRDLFDVPVLRRTDAEGHDEAFVRLGVTWFDLIGADVKCERTGAVSTPVVNHTDLADENCTHSSRN